MNEWSKKTYVITFTPALRVLDKKPVIYSLFLNCMQWFDSVDSAQRILKVILHHSTLLVG